MLSIKYISPQPLATHPHSVRHCGLQHSVIDTALCPAFQRCNTTSRVDSHHQLLLFNHNTIDIIDKNIRLYHEHEKIEDMQRHCILISPGKRERANHAKSNIPIDHVFAQGDAKSTRPELPLDLLEHLHGCLADFRWLRPLFGNKSESVCVFLGVNSLALPLILFANLLLVCHFLPLSSPEKEGYRH